MSFFGSHYRMSHPKRHRQEQDEKLTWASDACPPLPPPLASGPGAPLLGFLLWRWAFCTLYNRREGACLPKCFFLFIFFISPCYMVQLFRVCWWLWDQNRLFWKTQQEHSLTRAPGWQWNSDRPLGLNVTFNVPLLDQSSEYKWLSFSEACIWSLN